MKNADTNENNREKQAPLCKCRCGNRVRWNKHRKRWSTYLLGHSLGKEPWNKGLTKETDARMARIAKRSSETRLRLSAQGKLVTGGGWNKGLTAETDPRVARQGEGGGSGWSKGLTKETDARVARMAKTLARAYAEGRRTSPGHAHKGGYREDLGHFVRSSWEANFARLLRFLERKYEYEPKRFVFELDDRKTSYLPDFYIVDLDRYIEIKGFWRKGHREKLEQFLRAYPNIELDIIESGEYTKLEEKFSSLIPNWEQP